MRSMNLNGRWMNEVDECACRMNEWGRWMWMEDEWMRSMNVNGKWMNEVDECEWRWMNEVDEFKWKKDDEVDECEWKMNEWARWMRMEDENLG